MYYLSDENRRKVIILTLQASLWKGNYSDSYLDLLVSYLFIQSFEFGKAIKINYELWNVQS